MSNQYHCSGCDTRVVLVDCGGVARTLVCTHCGHEMNYEKSVDTEWVTGPKADENCEFCDYHISEK